MLYNIYKKNNLKINDITDFIIFFKNIHPAFIGINQFDASEFLRVLLEDICTDLDDAIIRNIYIILENTIMRIINYYYQKNIKIIFMKKNLL